MEPGRIYLIGFMGAGKSTVGRHLAEKMGRKFIDVDDLIERREGRPISMIFQANGELYFRSVERLCIKEVAKTKSAVIALGGGAFIDPENRAVLEDSGLTVWLKVSFAKASDRVKIGRTRPNFVNIEEARKLYDARQEYYALAKLHIATDDRPPAAVADELLRTIQGL